MHWHGFWFEQSLKLGAANGNDKYLSINQSGDVKTTNVSLDYESLTNSNFQLEIIVLVNDMPTNYPQNTWTATIIVNVRDDIAITIII